MINSLSLLFKLNQWDKKILLVFIMINALYTVDNGK